MQGLASESFQSSTTISQKIFIKAKIFHPLSLVTVISWASAETNLFDSHPISFPSSSSLRILNFFVQQEKENEIEADCGSGNTSTERVESSQTVSVPPRWREKIQICWFIRNPSEYVNLGEPSGAFFLQRFTIRFDSGFFRSIQRTSKKEPPVQRRQSK